MSKEVKDSISEEEKAEEQSIIARIIHLSKKHRDKRITVKVPTLAIVILLCVLLPSFAVGISTMITVKSRSVNLGLKDIGELSTQAGYFTNVQMINESKQLWGADIPLTQSKCIFSYDGIIKAGLDFESIELNVNELAHTISVELPEIRVLSNEVDPDSLDIYDETKSVFTPLNLSDVNQSLIKLKDESQEKAISNGILESARANAESLIRGFLAASYDLNVYSITFV